MIAAPEPSITHIDRDIAVCMAVPVALLVVALPDGDILAIITNLTVYSIAAYIASMRGQGKGIEHIKHEGLRR